VRPVFLGVLGVSYLFQRTVDEECSLRKVKVVVKIISNESKTSFPALAKLDLTEFVSELLPRILEPKRDLPKLQKNPKLPAVVREPVARTGWMVLTTMQRLSPSGTRNEL